jgi:hypothetical protein
MPKKMKIKLIKSNITEVKKDSESSNLESEVSEAESEEFSEFMNPNSKFNFSPVLSSGQDQKEIRVSGQVNQANSTEEVHVSYNRTNEDEPVYRTATMESSQSEEMKEPRKRFIPTIIESDQSFQTERINPDRLLRPAELTEESNNQDETYQQKEVKHRDRRRNFF